MSRITRISSTFAIMLIAYWTYALMAVPWIEPSYELRTSGQHHIYASNEDPVQLQMKQFIGLFPRDHWIWQGKTIVLESNRAKLLLQRYRNVEGGRMEIFPCVIVFPHEGPTESEEQRRRQSIILEAPGGALLEFDPPLDFKKPQATRLVSGRLKGDVIIRSDWKEPGPQDDLLIATRDVQISEKTISTPNPVEFHWGPHSGSGQNLEIKLVTEPPLPGSPAGGPNITGIESCELQHVHSVRFDLGDKSLSGGTASNAPVEIRCAGPFRFDVLNHVATFRDRVNISQPNRLGTVDQLDCDLLSLFFIDRPNKGNATADKDHKTDSLDIVPERVEAKGSPVVISAPSNNNFAARGPRIEYDLLKKTMHADGPGWCRGQPNNRPDLALEAVWRSELKIFPKERSEVITLSGGAALKMQNTELNADEIFFRLAPQAGQSGAAPVAEQASADDMKNLHPEMMLARQNVRLKSPQVSGNIDQLEVWFEESPEQPAENAATQTTAGAQPPNDPAARPAVGASPSPAAPAQQYELAGRSVSARVRLGGSTPMVSYLRAEDGVCIQETQTAKPGEQPLLLRGDRLEGFDMTSNAGRATIVGQPAHFEGGGLQLTGNAISVDCTANLLSVAGAGQMQLPLPAGGLGGPTDNGMPVAAPQQTASAPLTIDWSNGMTFNGGEIVFDGSVVAASALQQVCANTMTVALARPVRFLEMKAQESPQLSELRCNGNVRIENQSVDAQQQPLSFDHMQVASIAVNVLNGEMRAEGPGWLNSVRRGGGLMGGGGVGGGVAQPVALANQNQNALNCVHVDFQGPATGNFKRERLLFREQVKVGVAPVMNWNAIIAPNNPKLLGPNAAVLRCDQLAMAEVLAPYATKKTVELIAYGNTDVEGKSPLDGANFKARGQQIKYDEAKDLLILEGDGRMPAELFMQSRPGGEVQRHAAQSIYFWPKTKQYQESGMRSIEATLPFESKR